jgi:diguanylate cyclase (GGDEF)-like protein
MTPSEPLPSAEQSARLSACLEVGKQLTSSLHLPRILECIMEQVSRLIEAENWSLLLRDAESGELVFEVVAGVDATLLKGIKLKRGVGIAGHVAESGETLLLADVTADPRFHRQIDSMTGFSSQSIVCLPLRIRGCILGVIEVINPANMERFAERDLPILRILADYAAIALQNARDVESIRRLSVTDEYTGLFNARYLHDLLDRLLTPPGERRGQVVSVAFADIDNFKRVVDTHGHLLGSQVLKEVGQTMLAALGRGDTLAKYGGDEYVFVLPGRDREEARALITGIRRDIAATTYLPDDAHPVRVTASFGISTFPRDGDTKREILLRADAALYRVKNASKNSVASA